MDVTSSAITVVSSAWSLTIRIKQLIVDIRHQDENVQALEHKADTLAAIVGAVRKDYRPGRAGEHNIQEIVQKVISRLEIDLRAFEEELSKILTQRRSRKLRPDRLLKAWRTEVAAPTFDRLEKSMGHHQDSLQFLVNLLHGQRLDAGLAQVHATLLAVIHILQPNTTLQRRNTESTLVPSPEDVEYDDLNAEVAQDPASIQQDLMQIIEKCLNQSGASMRPSIPFESSSPPKSRQTESPGDSFRTPRQKARRPSSPGPRLAKIGNPLTTSISWSSELYHKRPISPPGVPPFQKSPPSGSSADKAESLWSQHSELTKVESISSHEPEQRQMGAELLRLVHDDREDYADTLDGFFKSNAYLEEVDDRLRTPLLVASFSNKPNIVAALLSHGADTKAADYKGKTALHLACENASVKVISLLLRAIDIARKPDSPTEVDVDAVDNIGRTPLHYSVQRDMVEAVRLLVDYGASINIKDKEINGRGGYTPIYYAIKHRYFAPVELLLNRGASIDPRCHKLDTKAEIKDLLQRSPGSDFTRRASTPGSVRRVSTSTSASKRKPSWPLRRKSSEKTLDDYADSMIDLPADDNSWREIDPKADPPYCSLPHLPPARYDSGQKHFAETDHDGPPRSKMAEIEEQILGGVEPAADGLGRATFMVHWRLQEFMASQFKDQGDTSPDGALGPVITLTGEASSPQAYTCEDYMIQTWPTSGKRLLDLLQYALDSPDSKSRELTSSMDTYVEVSVDDTGPTYVAVKGTRQDIIETAQQLAWIGAAFTTSSKDRIQYSEAIITESSKCLDITFSLKDLSMNESGCWHHLFTNPVIARGFPVAGRHNSEKGLELPLYMMAALGGARHAVSIADGLVIKGHSVMFFPVVRHKDSIQWHMVIETSGARISYNTDNSEYKSRLHRDQVDEKFLLTARTFLGWWDQAATYLGSDLVDYNRLDWSSTREPGQSVKITSAEFGFSSTMTGQLHFVMGAKEGTLHLPKTRLQSAEKYPVVLYDVDDQRGWFVLALGVIVHILSTRHHLQPYRVNGKRVDFLPYATNHDHWDISQNAKIKLSDDEDYYYVDAVLDIWSYLEMMLDEVQKIATTSGTNILLPGRSILYGWEFMDLVEELPILRRRKHQISYNNGGWPSLLKDLGATTLFGRGFGEIIKPVESTMLCRRWQSLPVRRDLLAISSHVLGKLLKQAGSGQDLDRLTSSGLRLIQGSEAYARCENTASGQCDCNRLHRVTSGRIKRRCTLQQSPENGCAILGGRCSSVFKMLRKEKVIRRKSLKPSFSAPRGSGSQKGPVPCSERRAPLEENDHDQCAESMYGVKSCATSIDSLDRPYYNQTSLTSLTVHYQRNGFRHSEHSSSRDASIATTDSDPTPSDMDQTDSHPSDPGYESEMEEILSDPESESEVEGIPIIRLTAPHPTICRAGNPQTHREGCICKECRLRRNSRYMFRHTQD